MKEKKQTKISLKVAIIIVCIPIAIVIIAIYFIHNKQYDISDTVSVITYKNKAYYIIQKDYEGRL